MEVSPHVTTGVASPRDPTTTINATDAPASVSAPLSLLARGATIGRYVVLDKIGIGGMGVVYAAYDPGLDRKLALKLLSATDDVTSIRRRRLLREAKAMAKFTHANVITVHDVGTVDDQVFVAMEFIDGGTLREWLREQRSWREIVDVFIRAGRGLWAAHRAGLVHRDFKPDNVMVGKDGRIIVMDFGLARAADGEGAPSESGILHRFVDASLEARPTGLEATVTAAGTVMGTPAYMSPEQHEGRATDARSDQFAFCVALYEALFHQRPFKGEELTELAVNVCCGNLIEPPTSSPVPSWIKAMLIKGLAVDPDERHADMGEVLSILEADRRAWTRRVLPILGVATVAGGGVAAGALMETERPCEHADERLEQTWNGQRATTLREAFVGTGLSFAEDTWPVVRGALDDYAAAWTSSYTETCEATHVRHEQSTELMDRRVGCLSRGRAELEALLALLSSGDPIAVENALAAVQHLPAPAQCVDAQFVSEAGPSPSEAQASRAKTLEDEVGQVSALLGVGLLEVGQRRAEALVAKTAALGYAPMHARALLVLAEFEHGRGQAVAAERSFREALAVALRGEADDVATKAAVKLVDVVGGAPSRYDEAEGWAELAAALLGRTGDDPGAEAELLAFRAAILRKGGRLREARDALERGVDLSVRAYGPGDVRVANASADLADVLAAMGERHRARELYERALKIDEATVGRDHPSSATILHALGDLALAAGEFGPALEYHLRGLKIREAVRGEQGVELIDSLRALGLAYSAMGRGQLAGQHLARATAVAEKAFGPAHPVTIAALADQADAAVRAGDAKLAETLLAEALERREAEPAGQGGADQNRLEQAMGQRAHRAPDREGLAAALQRVQSEGEDEPEPEPEPEPDTDTDSGGRGSP